MEITHDGVIVTNTNFQLHETKAESTSVFTGYQAGYPGKTLSPHHSDIFIFICALLGIALNLKILVL